MPDANEFVEVEVEGVGSTSLDGYVVILRHHDRRLPIRIGQCEAMAIMQRKQDDFESPRPLTHDFAVNLWRHLGAEMVELRLDDFFQDTYYGKLVFEQHDRRIEVDCRPSDGIAMALTARAPIYVAETIMDEEGQDTAEDGPEDDV